MTSMCKTEMCCQYWTVDATVILRGSLGRHSPQKSPDQSSRPLCALYLSCCVDGCCSCSDNLSAFNECGHRTMHREDETCSFSQSFQIESVILAALNGNIDGSAHSTTLSGSVGKWAPAARIRGCQQKAITIPGVQQSKRTCGNEGCMQQAIPSQTHGLASAMACARRQMPSYCQLCRAEHTFNYDI